MLDEIKQGNDNHNPPPPDPLRNDGEESPESVRLFETNKRLLKQLETVKAQRDELEALINPVIDWKLVPDCSEALVARMVTMGWVPRFVTSAPRPGVMGDTRGLSPVVVTIMFERKPEPPTPTSKLVAIPETVQAEMVEIEADAEDSKMPAAMIPTPLRNEGNMIERVVPLPTLRLPTYDTAELNRIAVANAVRRTQEQFRDYGRPAPRPADVVEGHLA